MTKADVCEAFLDTVTDVYEWIQDENHADKVPQYILGLHDMAQVMIERINKKNKEDKE